MKILAVAPQPTPDEAAAIEAALQLLAAGPRPSSVRAGRLWQALGMPVQAASEGLSWRERARLEQIIHRV
jgi:hypothetical protein